MVDLRFGWGFFTLPSRPDGQSRNCDRRPDRRRFAVCHGRRAKVRSGYQLPYVSTKALDLARFSCLICDHRKARLSPAEETANHVSGMLEAEALEVRSRKTRLE